MIELVSKLVSFKTVYPNFDELDKCINFIKEYISQNKSLYIKKYEFNNFKSIVVSNADSKDLDVIFCGHLDVVPADESMFTARKEGNILYGRGVADMKSQVAVMLEIMKELNTNKKVALFLTSDEEMGGFYGTKKLLFDEGYNCKVAIVPDGGFDFKLVNEEKGVMQLKLSIKGKGAHSSELWKGNNAITKLFEIYNKMLACYPIPSDQSEWLTSVNLAKIEGGDVLNKVPSFASMYLDIRHTYSDKKEEIISSIKKISEEIDIEVLAEGEAFFTNQEDFFVKKYLDICQEELEHEVQTIKFNAASDGRLFTSKGIPCIIMSPIGGNAHCPDEWADLSSLESLSNIYRKYICSI